MKKKYLLFVAAGLAICSTSALNAQKKESTKANMKKKSKVEQPSTNNNPLLKKSKLQYQAPEFDKIKDKDFKPAFDYGLNEQIKQIEAIANNTDKPTFENTIVALENSGQNLRRAITIFSNLNSANTNPFLQALDEEYAPIFAAHTDKIFLNEQLFQKIKRLYATRANLKLDAEDVRLIEYYNQQFEIAGANLNNEQKEELKKINEQLATLQSQFNNKLLAARKAGGLIIEDVKLLDGLSSNEIDAAAENAKVAGMPGKYLLALQNTTQQPLLQNLKNRTVREKLFKASWLRAEKDDENDTRETLQQLARLRLKKAQIMGKKNFAEWKLQDQMAKTPENAMNLLAKMAAPAVKKAKQEAEEIQKLIDKQNGGFKLEPWDWNFYAEQVRKAQYDLDDNEIKPYFEVRTVLEKGVFYAAKELYGLTFKVRKDLPVYHPDVVAYEVFDKDGKSLAIYYLDFYTRDNKNGGAWMSNFVEQSYSLGQKPVIVNVYNYQKPAPGKPSLISYDDVTTLFHEFGHSIHGMFASQKYISISGTNTPRDFVEFPSQINEYWALEPSVLKNYALHYKTGKPIPNELVKKIKNAKTFNEGYNVTEIVAAATLDMAWHTITDESEIIPANEFEKMALDKFGLLVNEVPTRYHSPYFLHIWSNGYSAAYYAYLWSEMLDFNALEYFENNGGMKRENGDRFRKYILSVGNSMDLNQAFRNFTGKDPEIEPLLRGRGLIK
ncbi:MAG TPA: M3 family metallopeptidase [Chitinophagaceae bacterium]|nr:M3 family metallopeptidase [Chitinophagaceae bacterium]MCC6635936.1 M3 family metallopeptidase [Chitinophagaceae bacterium]HMZ45343.1 M3 family metallopeptidase [Chitinophagaceae bacterium]HNF28786.1 M3 family metallopeptidase [Chitinophagaceae bacterium]HNL81842.1 M3 family metallopeptidase [Chitinophagaceae bacterium]